MIAAVIAFVCAVQSALAAKAPPQSLPTGTKKPAAKQKTFAPPVMNEVKPKAAAPVVVSAPESAYEQGSESAAVAEEPEADLPEAPAGNALPAQVVTAPKARLVTVVTPPSVKHEVGPAPAPRAAKQDYVVKSKEVEIEENDDGEVEIEAEMKLAPAPGKRAARKFDEDSYQFTDEELGISQYMKKAEPAAPAAADAGSDADDKPQELRSGDKPLVELPEPLDGYSPEYQEGKKGQEEQPEEAAQEDGAVMIAEHKDPGSLGYEMDTVNMLADSLEPTGERAEVAKRK